MTAMNSATSSFTQAELDLQYNARATVPDIAPMLRDYAALSAQARSTLSCALNVAYGAHPDETLDIFFAQGAVGAPVFIYLHGGYWRLLSKDDSSFMAPALTAAGMTVVAVNYSLAPTVTLDQIVDQTRRAVAWVHNNISQYRGDGQKLIIAGSSAGGHLAAMVLARGWQEAYGFDHNALVGAMLLSGLFDITPLVNTHINEWMRLTEADALRNSPLFALPDNGPWILVSYGSNETDTFKQQSQDFLANWRAKGFEGEFVDVPGTNHFDLVLELNRLDSPLVQHLLRRLSAGGSLTLREKPPRP
jgi:arylformamidase